MKRYLWPLQFVVTIFLSCLIQDNVLKTSVLLVFWGVSFYPLSKREVVFFVLCSSIFTFSNWGALQNLAFEFTKKDILLMPYNEVFMWGFYCLNAHRCLPLAEPREGFRLLKFLAYAVFFAVSFSVIRSELWLLGTLALLMFWALHNFGSRRALAYIGYFLFMGVVVEFTGLAFRLWRYPQAEYLQIPLWAPLMWGHIGLVMSLFIDQFLQNPRRAVPLAEASPSVESGPSKPAEGL